MSRGQKDIFQGSLQDYTNLLSLTTGEIIREACIAKGDRTLVGCKVWFCDLNSETQSHSLTQENLANLNPWGISRQRNYPGNYYPDIYR
jgi:hypothetical protein